MKYSRLFLNNLNQIVTSLALPVGRLDRNTITGLDSIVNSIF